MKQNKWIYLETGPKTLDQRAECVKHIIQSRVQKSLSAHTTLQLVAIEISCQKNTSIIFKFPFVLDR